MKPLFRKIPVLFLLIMGIVVSLSLTSCSDDDDDKIASDPASKIVGVYIGTGSLDYYGLNYEKYQGMKLYVTKSSNEYVIIKPYLANGKSFFVSDTGHVYKITKTAAGDYVLISSDYPSAQVTITRKGHIDYSFPYVAVDDLSGLELSFSGNKE